MRGNETNAIGTSHETREFPIPMRGNEPFRPTASAAPAGRFPIPMRGNEVMPSRGAMRLPLSFPIPMRGNEERSLWKWAGAWDVSDPHEG